MTLPKRWLIHSIKYDEYEGRNDWGDDSYKDSVSVNYVRFDNSSVFSRDSNQNKVLADAIIFVDAKYSAPKIEFKERSRVWFNGKDYIVKKVIPCYYPTENKIRHWELEVI